MQNSRSHSHRDPAEPRGLELEDLVATWGPVPVPTAVDWVLQAAEDIAEAHARGVSHRRLRLSSLFLIEEGDGAHSVKVRDFGRARALGSFWDDAGIQAEAMNALAFDPAALRSIQYVAPEDLQATTIDDTRADIWSLGAILHTLVAGREPFAGQTLPRVRDAVLRGEPSRLSRLRPAVPLAVDAAVHRCLQKDPAARFPDVSALAHALVSAGSPRALSSLMHIDRALGVARPGQGRVPEASRALSPRRRTLAAPVRRADASRVVFREPASARVVMLALTMLTVLGCAAFVALFVSVHGGAAGAWRDLRGLITTMPGTTTLPTRPSP